MRLDTRRVLVEHGSDSERNRERESERVSERKREREREREAIAAVQRVVEKRVGGGRRRRDGGARGG